jgi:Kef-type K+ transport system membrane component KefB
MFIVSLLTVLIAAYLGKLLSQKINQPTILGELIVGMIIGNLGIITLNETMGNIADFGVLLLLFSTGLAVNFKEFKQLGKAPIIVASLGVILPFVMGYYVSIYFGYSKIVSLFIGTSLVATSIGISSQVLSELKMIGMRLGTLIIGSAIADDVMGIVMIGTILGIALNGSINLKELSITILLTIIFLIVSFTLAIKLFKKLSTSFIFTPKKTEDILLPVLITGLFLV